MESTVEELGKLKYAVALEVSLDEIKPIYDSIYKYLRQTRLNGFRPGKHPKGWLEKRFKSAMYEEAVERVIPKYIEEACKTHSLVPATVPSIQDLDYNKKSPLTATIHFEVAPVLPELDFSRIKLERKEFTEITSKDIEEEYDMMLKREETLMAKEGDDVVAEDGDWVRVDCKGNINGEEFDGSNNEDLLFKLGDSDFDEFQPTVKGMKLDEEKDADVVLTERFEKNVGETAQFRFVLKEISTSQRPVMDEAFYSRYKVTNEAEFKEGIEHNIKERRISENKNEYRISIRTQLPELFDEFELPETLVTQANEQIDGDMESMAANEEVTEEEVEIKRQEEYEAGKLDLKMKFILEAIGKAEKVPFNEGDAAREFIALAQMTGQSAEQLIQLPFGRNMYERILYRKQEDAILDRITARVFGDPIEEPAAIEQEHVHDENCDHDHE